jgi:drug/metabolite transporter (DMT)-like permease
MAVCVRLAVQDMPVLQVTFVRFLGSFVLLLATTRGRGLWPRRSSVGRLLQRSFLGAFAISCYFVAIDRAGAGLATLLHSTYPVWTALFAATLMGEPFTGRIAMALALNVVGATLAIRGEVAAVPGIVTGGLIGLLGGVLAGGAVATAGALRRTESASLITVWFMAVGAAVTVPSMLADLPPITPRLALALVALVVTSTGGQWLLHHGLGYVSATVGSLAAATSIVTATVLEGVLLGESVDAQVLLGGLLMLTAVGLAARPSPVASAVHPAAEVPWDDTA